MGRERQTFRPGLAEDALPDPAYYGGTVDAAREALGSDPAPYLPERGDRVGSSPKRRRPHPHHGRARRYAQQLAADLSNGLTDKL